eukprot:1186001-Prorocentrum_minimum.AAC.1
MRTYLSQRQQRERFRPWGWRGSGGVLEGGAAPHWGRRHRAASLSTPTWSLRRWTLARWRTAWPRCYTSAPRRCLSCGSAPEGVV